MYTVKWIEDNLGITRKTIRYYEDNGLISKNLRNPLNNYRDYDESDIDRIWSVKTLMKIGYTAKEVKGLIHTKGNNFYASLSDKIDELERKCKEYEQYCEFAKTIKLTGRIPVTNEYGSIKFDNFISYACEKFNFYADETITDTISIGEKTNQFNTSHITSEDIEKLEKITKQVQIYTFHAHCNVLSNLCTLKHSDYAVQKVVEIMYNDFCNFLKQEGMDSFISKVQFADHMISNFYDDGDIAKANKIAYGEKECKFIADAIAYFGGYESSEKLC